MVNRKGIPFHVTHTHATAASASETGVDGKIHFITDVAASSDKVTAIALVKDDSTVIWQIQLTTNDLSYSHHFDPPLEITEGAAASVGIDGTSACKANIAGYTTKIAGEGAAIRGY